MKNIVISICILTLILISGNCKRPARNITIAEGLPSEVQTSQVLTLSGEQLIFLDWDGRISIGAKVIRKRLIPDSGVEYDIHFRSKEPGFNMIDYVSSGIGGQGALIGFDISDYKVFSLIFTLVSIDGASGPNLPQELVVGAVIGPTVDGKLSGYIPETLSFSQGRTSVVSSIPIFGINKIHQIGIHAHIAKPENWGSSNHMVTIRVEPVKDIPIPPWP